MALLTSALWESLVMVFVAENELDTLDIRLIDLLVSTTPPLHLEGSKHSLASPNLGDEAEESLIAFRLVMACLCATVKMGGVRIPLEPKKLTEKLTEWLNQLPTSTPTTEPKPLSAIPWESRHRLANRSSELFQKILSSTWLPSRFGDSESYAPFIVESDHLYFQKHFAAEKSISESLSHLIRSGIEFDFASAAYRNAIDTVLFKIPLRSRENADAPPLTFTPSQRLALIESLRHPFMVITGGPGTGKTALSTNLLRVLARAFTLDPQRIFLAAPTGRAAQRLTEALHQGLDSIQNPELADQALRQLEGQTLHRLLEWSPQSGTFRRNASRPLEADLVIVDEASMLDLFLARALLEAVVPGTRLIWVGDKNQLPSIDAGSVLADLLPISSVTEIDRLGVAWFSICFPEEMAPAHENDCFYPSVFLDRSHRSAAKILRLASAIQSGDAGLSFTLCEKIPPGQEPSLPMEFEAGTHFIATDSPDEIVSERQITETTLTQWAQAFFGVSHPPTPVNEGNSKFTYPICYLETLKALLLAPHDLPREKLEASFLALFSVLESQRVLTVLRQGPKGSEGVNRFMGHWLKQHSDPGAVHEPLSPRFHGAPILITRNAPDQGLYNGDLGLVLRLNGGYQAVFRHEQQWKTFPLSQLPPHELAFALTVHKCQGSEYGKILLVLPPAKHPLLIRELLYTAVTRARHGVYFLGTESAFVAGVNRQLSRDTGLHFRIRQSLTNYLHSST